jgi:hypothetical protein
MTTRSSHAWATTPNRSGGAWQNTPAWWRRSMSSLNAQTRARPGGPRRPASARVPRSPDPQALEPPRHLALLEQPPPLHLVRGQLAARGQPVDLLRLAAEHCGELVSGQEGVEDAGHGGESLWLGNIKSREVPEGTKGHRDLRRRAERVHLGGGLRPWVASPGDLVRMMEALGRPEEEDHLDAMRRVVGIEGGWHVEREIRCLAAPAAPSARTRRRRCRRGCPGYEQRPSDADALS